MTDIRHRILARRNALRMSQKLLAGAAQVSRSTVQRAERGLPISHESMRSLCAVLDITLGIEAPDASAATMPEPTAAADARFAQAPRGPEPEGPPSAGHERTGPAAAEPAGRACAPADDVPTDAAADDDALSPETQPMDPMPPPRHSRAFRSAYLAVPMAVGIAFFGLAWHIRDGIRAQDASFRQMGIDRVEQIASGTWFPVDARQATLACGRAVSVRDCIAGEEASMHRGSPLWQAASHDLRRDCFRSSQDAPQVASSLAACLAADKS